VKDSADKLVGKRLGSYLLEGVLGSGDTGTVYAAIDPGTGKRAAIKVFRADIAHHTVALERVRAEALACSELQHENIVKVLDFVIAGDEPAHVVMELLGVASGGESLHALLKGRRRLDPRFTVELARQVCAALAAAHERGITHRDLKPQNIFVSEDGTVTVLDFGISALLDAARNAAPMHTTGLFAGTPYCMAPELARGEPTDSRTDIYGLAVVLYRALTGVLPFQGVTFVEVLASMLTKPVPPFSDHLERGEIPPELERVVMRALSKDPAERQADVETLDRELDAALSTLPAKAVPRAEERSDGKEERPAAAPPLAPVATEAIVASAQDRARRRFFWLRVALYPTLLAILLLTYGLLLGDRRVDQRALGEVPLLGVVVLALGFLLELGFRSVRRKAAEQPPAAGMAASRVGLGWLVIALFICAGTYLLQLFGSVASYMVMLYSLVIGFSRLRLGSRTALYATTLATLAYLGVVVAEQLRLIPYGRLFVDVRTPDMTLAAVTVAGVVALLWLTYAGVHLLATGLEQRAQALALVTDDLVARTAELSEALDELKAAQGQLLESETQGRVGRLVAGILHEINTPLGTFASSLDTLGRARSRVRAYLEPRAAGGDADAKKALATIDAQDDLTNVLRTSNERISGVVGSLSRFVSLDESDIKVIDVCRAIDDALTLLSPALDDRIQVRWEAPDDAISVRCYPAKLNQALLNLLQNATAAIEGCGVISIEAARCGDKVTIVISDDGQGIPADMQGGLFDYGFTTKKGGRVGLHLGLPLSKRWVEEIGGRLELTSSEGEGTTVEVTLPADRRS
jgi:signal transduction histidine kinase/tRNA A-37 threonylcarbamoyl transferase component Bud32